MYTHRENIIDLSHTRVLLGPSEDTSICYDAMIFYKTDCSDDLENNFVSLEPNHAKAS